MKQTENILLPILESGDKYTKDIQNEAFVTIDKEIKGLNEKVNTLDNVEDVKSIYSQLDNLNSSLDNLESEVNELKEGNINIDLTNYATKTELSNKSDKEHIHNQYLTEHQDISGKVDKVSGKSLISDSEIERLSTLKNYDDSNIRSQLNDIENEIDELRDGNIEIDLTNYVTKSELSTKADKTELHSHTNKTVLDGISSAKVTEWNNKSTFSGNYNDLTNKPTIPTLNGYATEQYVNEEIKKIDVTEQLTDYAKKSELHSHSNKSVLDGITTSKISEWNNKSTFDGNYNSLTNKPTIPTKVSQLTNDSGYLTTHQDLADYAKKTELFSKNYNDLTNKPIIPSIDGLATVKYVDNELLEIKAEKSQLEPLFMNSYDELVEKGESSKVYVLDDNYIYKYQEVVIGKDEYAPSYTNRLPLSTDSSGNTIGILEGKRYNSSDSLVDLASSNATGFIPAKKGDTIYFKNIGFGMTHGDNGSIYIRAYYNDYTITNPQANCNATLSAIATISTTYERDENGNIVKLVLDGNRITNNVGFIRMAYIPMDGEPIITINEEITDLTPNPTPTGKKWVSTGHAFIPTSYDSQIATLTETTTKINNDNLTLGYKIDANTNEIKKLKTKVDNIEKNGVSSSITATAIPDFWKEKVDSLEDTIKGLQDQYGAKCIQFVWGADIHGVNGYTNPSNGAGTSVTKNIGHVAQYTTEKYDIPFVMFSGDIMSQGSHAEESTVHQEHENMWKLFEPINKEKLLIEKGNHDGAYGSPVNGVYYLKNISGKEVYNNLFRKQALDRNRVFGGDGSYFYVDTQYFRVIMLNCQTDGDGSNDTNGYAIYNSMKNSVYGTEQLKWLSEKALNTDKYVIISAHQPPIYSIDGPLLTGILNAYNTGGSYNNSISISTDTWGNGISSEYKTSSADVNFSNMTNRGKVLAFFHGHIHKDTINDDSYTFIVASITTSGADVRDTNPPLRTANTATETALDIVTVSPNKIHFTRLGAGTDREVNIK